MDEMEIAIINALQDYPNGASTTEIHECIKLTPHVWKVAKKLKSLMAYGFVDRTKTREKIADHTYSYFWRIHKDDAPRVWSYDLLQIEGETATEHQQRVQTLIDTYKEDDRWLTQ